MNRLGTALATLALMGAASGALACGGIAVIDPGSQGQGGSGGSSNASNSSSTGSGGGSLDVRLVDAIARANCTPPVAADPLVLNFTLSFENNGSSAVEATVDSVGLDAGILGTAFTVDPTTSGTVAPASTVEVAFDKRANSAVGDSGCSYCMSTNIRLQMTLLVAGQSVNVDEPIDSISCVF